MSLEGGSRHLLAKQSKQARKVKRPCHAFCSESIFRIGSSKQLPWIHGYFNPSHSQYLSDLAAAQHMDPLNHHDNKVEGGLCWNTLSLEEAILFLEKGTLPVPPLEDLACILHKCRKERSPLAPALRLHAYMRKHELDVHASLGNSLLLLLVEAGSMYHAEEVLERLGHVDERSWNFLISGYVNNGELTGALYFYQKLQNDGFVQCNAYTIVALLKACTKLKDMEWGFQVHADAARKGLLETDIFVGSTLIDMYVKCGLVARAQEVFDKLSIQNVVSWTALMAGYAEHGHGEEALQFYEQMHFEGISPSPITFICILKVCGSLSATDKGRKVHGDLVEKGWDRDIVVGSTLVHMYAKCGSLVTAQYIFDKLPFRDVALWNILLAGYAEDSSGEKVIDLFKQMQRENISSDSFTFVCISKACGKIGSLHKGGELHCDITRKGLERDVFVGSTLVDMYAKCGALSEAQDVFDNLLVRAVVTWNALIAGYVENRYFDEALYYFEKMQPEGVPPDDITFVCVLKACGSMGAVDMTKRMHEDIARKGLEIEPLISNTIVDSYAKCGLLDEAQEVFNGHTAQTEVSWNALLSGFSEHDQSEEALICFKLMQQEGISPGVVTFLCSLKACARMKDSDSGGNIYGMIVKIGLSENDGFVGSTLVDMYAKCGLVADAQAVFDRLVVRDVVSWTALIAGYVEQAACDEVLKCFHQMQGEGVSPVAATFVCCLKACACNETVVKGQEVHSEIVGKGLERDLVVGSTLVDMYAKCGLLAEARNVFNKISFADIVSWTALMTGYVEHGSSEEALCCFKKVQQEGVLQNVFTFACGLKACAIAVSIQEGQEIHDEIVRRGFERDLFVGSSLVNMYAKCGLLVEAHEVFDKLPVQSVVSFNALLGGYAAHVRCEEALLFLDRMHDQGIHPDVGTYICSLKICGLIGAMEKGYSIHAEIVMKGLLKRDPFTGSALVGMYAKFGRLVDAHQIFGKLPIRDAVTWIALIEGYVEHRGDMEALECFDQMQHEGVTPVSVTFICSLRCCSSRQDIGKARELHVDIAKKGFERDHSVGKMLVVTYARCAFLDEAKQIFDKLEVQDDFSWTALVRGYAGSGRAKEALDCYKQMHFQGMSASACTYEACGNVG